MSLSKIDWLIEIISGALLILLIVIPILYYDDISHRVPTHFNIQGQPDAYGSKGNIWIMPIIGGVLYLLFLLIVNVADSLQFYFPVKVNSTNRKVLTDIANRTLRVVKVSILILLNYLSYKTIIISMGETVKSEMYSFFGIMILIFFPIVVMFVKMSRVARSSG